MRLLLVEDTPRLRELLIESVHARRLAHRRLRDRRGRRGSHCDDAYDLLLIDLGLPDGDGLDLIRALRRNGVRTPILAMTARGAIDERIAGLDAGADDYLVKPFNHGEFLARCRALLRRSPETAPPVLTAGRLDLRSRQLGVLTCAGQEIPLTPRERTIAEILMREVGRTVHKRKLEHALSEFGDDISTNAVELAISRLRKKLGAYEIRRRARDDPGAGLSPARVEAVSRAAPSLIALVVRRIVLFAAIAMVAQVATVLLEYWRDTQNLGRLAIELETAALAPGLQRQGRPLLLSAPGKQARPVQNAGRRLFHACARPVGGCALFQLLDWMRRLLSDIGNQKTRFLDDGAQSGQTPEHFRRPQPFGRSRARHARRGDRRRSRRRHLSRPRAGTHRSYGAPDEPSARLRSGRDELFDRAGVAPRGAERRTRGEARSAGAGGPPVHRGHASRDRQLHQSRERRFGARVHPDAVATGHDVGHFPRSAHAARDGAPGARKDRRSPGPQGGAGSRGPQSADRATDDLGAAGRRRRRRRRRRSIRSRWRSMSSPRSPPWFSIPAGRSRSRSGRPNRFAAIAP